MDKNGEVPMNSIREYFAYFVDFMGYLAIMTIFLNILYKWEMSVLEEKMKEIIAIARGMSSEEQEVYLCSPKVAQVIEVLEVRRGIPRQERHSQEYVRVARLKKQINEVYQK